ncbi:ATP-binding cassette domain-containing protein [Qiania dongpingensis]|uniref:Sugar ABC transporter ATP-binding protein n=1 Tax=Qiania dongpingensis TaxID=2763669 RepID=A0A7G9G1G6_9FIRM|nr:ATP-binding cassette domain-containing protein [Qiania dongpingensis]QNM04648.1 sugar ABC transporter ATP-binding protein [Qiania dongpingensis]
MRRELLRMEHITKTQFDIKMLDDLTLNVYSGEILGVLGLSGSGKTLVSRILAGKDISFSGDVYVQEEPVEDFTSFIWRKGIFCILSVDGLVQELSIAENIFVMQPDGRPYERVRTKKICRESRKILEFLRLGHLNPRIPAKNLSRYEQCMIQVARALVAKAELIVMDTIFEAMSREEQIKLEQSIFMLRDTGIGFLITSRFGEYLIPVSDRIAVLRGGHNVRTFYREEFSQERLLRVMLGFRHIDAGNMKAESGQKEVLRFENTELYGLKGFSLAIKEGEAVGLWELQNERNMALCTLLLGEQKGYRGKIYLKGEPFVPRDIPRAVKRGIGVIRNDPLKTGLVPSMTAADNLLIPAVRKITGAVLNKGIYKFIRSEHSGLLEADIIRSRTEELDIYDQYRILMEKWALDRPAVLLCINPCITSDVVSNHIIFEYMNRMRKNGSGILTASSNLNYMMTICSRIVVFYGESSWLEFSRDEFSLIDSVLESFH